MKWIEKASFGEIRYRLALYMIDRAVAKVMPAEEARMWADWINQAATAFKKMDNLDTAKVTARFQIKKAGAYRPRRYR